ncbi:MAG: DHH family phosphoesterase [Flammeovirgaceae bacterium]|jgi:bifunctional oligoribonuclease and PAP phosphatase NrnA|nr:DHH family phosphoesterase [Flammeovirgaceae bacterium]
MASIETLIHKLTEFEHVVITTHANPDADALGSSLGLYHFLIARGHKVTIVTPTDYPDFISWLPGNQEVLKFGSNTDHLIKEIIDQASLIFCLDFSGLDRLQDLSELVKNATAKKVMIDHHLEPENFDNYRLWDTRAAATAELIYDFILMVANREAISADIANCLYAGIMTDTGSFRHSNTTSKVHRTVADLIDLGANVTKVSSAIYDTNSLNRLRFIGFSLLEKLIVHQDLNIAYFVISEKDINQFELQKGDTEGLVNYALSISGIVMAALIKESENKVKLSLRSVGDYSVNKFARDHFNGGGHKNAAGGVSYLSLDKTILKFETALVDFKEKYKLKS